MNRLADRIKAFLHPKDRRRPPRLSEAQSRVLRRNLKALLHTKEALAEHTENAA